VEYFLRKEKYAIKLLLVIISTSLRKNFTIILFGKNSQPLVQRVVKYALTKIVGLVSTGEQIGDKFNNFGSKFNNHHLGPDQKRNSSRLGCFTRIEITLV
jgi:hypothetical protein